MASRTHRTFRVLYDALAKLTEYEEMALAEAHAREPKDFLSRWNISVGEAEKRPVDIDEPFHDRGKEAFPAPGPAEAVDSTFGFACHLADGAPRTVTGDAGGRNFRYLDRELFLARTLAREARIEARSLDLLLVGEDGLPIIVELKRRRDRLPYYALVQLMVHAVELALPDQRERLQRNYHAAGFQLPDAGPFFDIAVMSYQPPPNWTHLPASLAAASAIASACLKDAEIGSLIRRIDFIEATPVEDRLTFHTLRSDTS